MAGHRKFRGCRSANLESRRHGKCESTNMEPLSVLSGHKYQCRKLLFIIIFYLDQGQPVDVASLDRGQPVDVASVSVSVFVSVSASVSASDSIRVFHLPFGEGVKAFLLILLTRLKNRILIHAHLYFKIIGSLKGKVKPHK